MKVEQYLFYLLFLLVGTPALQSEVNLNNTGDLLAQSAVSISQLNLLHNSLTELNQQAPSPKIEGDIAMIEAILETIQVSIHELNSVEQLDLRPNDEKDNEENQQPTPEQIVQANQQQIIDNLINAIEQSNATIEKLTRPNRWKNIKIGIYLVSGTAAAIGVIVLGYQAYKKIKSFFMAPIEEMDKEIEQQIKEVSKLGDQLTENVENLKDNLQPIKKRTNEIKKAVKGGIKVLDNVLKNDFPKLKDEINEKIATFRILEELRNIRLREKEKIDELEQEIKRLKKQTQTNDQEQNKKISELKQKMKRESSHMKVHSQRLDLLLENDLILAKEHFSNRLKLCEAREKMGLNNSPIERTENQLEKIVGPK
ncbi:hypothetical protein KKA53_02030 [Candidatus Dependentiae bacterium]|nr:hypothetical protein [Candidatus Dependentiae bacterium]